jgi:copper(I)-binding protein
MYKGLMLIMVSFILLILPVAVAGEDITVDEQTAEFSRVKPDVGTVFLRMTNNTKTDDALSGIEVNIKGVYGELHDVKQGSMIKVIRIPVPAGTTVTLKRGGLHIMLFNLPIEVKEGDEFTLSLLLEKSGKKEIKVRFSSAGHDMHRH